MPATIALVALFATQAMGLQPRRRRSSSARSSPRPTRCSPATSASARPASTRTAGEPRVQPAHRGGHQRRPRRAVRARSGVLVAEEGGTGWIAEWLAADVLYAVVVASVDRRRRAGYGDRRRARAAARPRLPPRHEFDEFVGARQPCSSSTAPSRRSAPTACVAVFWAGFAFRRYEFGHEVNRRVHDGADEYAKLLELARHPRARLARHVEGLGEPGLAGLAARAAAAARHPPRRSSCRCRPARC